jgi:uncharacterized membrane protein YczE
MNQQFMKNYPLRVFLYVFGVFVLGFGINILSRSTLGLGAWDTVSKNFSYLIHSTWGIAALIINVSVLAFVLFYNRNIKYALILIPIISLSFVIDLWDILILGSLTIDVVWLQYLSYIGGAVLLSLGLALIIVSRFPAMVYDELTVVLMKILKVKKFFTMRIMIELFAIALATVFGFLAGIKFGAVNYGSFILAIAIGPIISIHMKWLNALLKTESIS